MSVYSQGSRQSAATLELSVATAARLRHSEIPKAYRTLMKTLLFALLILCAPVTQAQEKSETVYNPQKDLTTVCSQSIQLARDKEESLPQSRLHASLLLSRTGATHS